MRWITYKIIALLLITSNLEASKLGCYSFYKQVSNYLTPTASASKELELIQSQLSAILIQGSSFEDLNQLSRLFQTLSKSEQTLILDKLLSIYPELNKNPSGAQLGPKRAIDYVISKLINPHFLFKSWRTLLAYREYLNNFKLANKFIPSNMILNTLLHLHTDLTKNGDQENSQLLVYGSFINGRATEHSDIDVSLYTGEQTPIKFSLTESFLNKKNYSQIIISSNKGNIKNIDTDIQYSLLLQPVVILISRNEFTFYIRGLRLSDPISSYKVSISEIKESI